MKESPGKLVPMPIGSRDKKMSAKILCLFDSEEARQRLQSLLGDGYELEIVPTILAALQSLKKEIPAAIVVQLHLGEESCFDFLNAVENNADYAKVPVITCCTEDVFDKSIEEYLIRVTRFLGSKSYVCGRDFYSPKLPIEVARCISQSKLGQAC